MDHLTQWVKPDVIFGIGIIWSLIWKGAALWQAARRSHITWFVVLLLVNTFGLLEILYLTYLKRFDLFSQQVMVLFEEQNKKRSGTKR